MQIELILKCEKLLINKLISLFLHGNHCIALTIDNSGLNIKSFCFRQSKSSKLRDKRDQDFETSTSEEQEKKEKIRAKENREEDFVFICSNHITLLGWFVQPLLQDIYLISNKGEEF